MYYVYELVNSKDNQVFYVGKGQKNRMYDHVRKFKSNQKFNNMHLYYKLKNIFDSGNTVIYRKENFEIEADAFSKEIELIKLYREQKINLCNITDGGEGSSGLKRVFTEEHKQKLSDRKFDNPTRYWKDKKFTEIHCVNLSNSHKGKVPKNKGISNQEFYGKEKAEEIKNKNIEAHKDKVYSDEVNMKKALFDSKHPKATFYIIENLKDGTKEEIKTTKAYLSKKYNITIWLITKMIKEGYIQKEIKIRKKKNNEDY